MTDDNRVDRMLDEIENVREKIDGYGTSEISVHKFLRWLSDVENA